MYIIFSLFLVKWIFFKLLRITWTKRYFVSASKTNDSSVRILRVFRMSNVTQLDYIRIYLTYNLGYQINIFNRLYLRIYLTSYFVLWWCRKHWGKNPVNAETTPVWCLLFLLINCLVLALQVINSKMHWNTLLVPHSFNL